MKPSSEKEKYFRIPDGYRFQKLIGSGDSLGDGNVLGHDLDFTGYIPINKSNTEGYLSIGSELKNAECSMLQIKQNPDGQWKITQGKKVPLQDSTVVNAIGYSRNFCSGGISPWGTSVHGEETLDGGDYNNDGYEDMGWFVEFIPEKAEIKNQTGGHSRFDKLYALGRISHENICFANDRKTCYYGADDLLHGYVYKFIADKEEDLSAGKLFVLKLNRGKKSTTGKWIRIPNSTKSEQNKTVDLSIKAGATNFSGVEDCEINPINGKIYFTAKYPGKLYSFSDSESQIKNLQIVAEPKNYTIQTAEGEISRAWHSGATGNDNLAFDNNGTLFVLNDGGGNEIWVLHRDHSPEKPHVSLFAVVPYGYEPTGMTLNPDNSSIFLSLQGTGPGTEQLDSFNNKVKWNKSITLVITKK